MDYSLLLAIEKNKVLHRFTNLQDERDSQTRDSSARYLKQSLDREFTYHLSVIDFLQDWNWKKRLERFAMTKLPNKDPAGLSAIEPSAYQKRFQRFMHHIFIYDLLDSTDSADTEQLSRAGREMLD